MKWRGRRQCGNIEDRRGTGGGFGGGFGGMPGGPRMRIPGGRASGGSVSCSSSSSSWRWCSASIRASCSTARSIRAAIRRPPRRRPVPAANDEMKQFVGVVVADTETYWTKAFTGSGVDLRKAEGGAVLGPLAVGLRAGRRGDRAVLLSDRSQGLYRPQLLRPAPAAVRRRRRFRRSLCAGPRDRPSRPEPDRRAARLQQGAGDR